jgi:hypothetical protein
MAYAKITLEHPQSGIIKTAPVGFSWTVFVFGPIVALIRGDMLGGFGMVLLIGLTYGISYLVCPFFYNKFYIKRLLKKGFKVVSVEGSDVTTLRGKLGINLPQK